MTSPASRPEPSPRRLLTGPAGSGKTHRALDCVRTAATRPAPRGRAAGDPGDALLVLPTYAQAMHLRRVALSRWDARALLDDVFTTFTAAGERFLDGFRVRILPTAAERDRLMDEAVAQTHVELFQEVRDRPGFRARLLRLVKEVKQSGRAPDEARAGLAAGIEVLDEAGRERLDGFLRVFAAYDALLQSAGLEDHEDTLRRLLRQLRTGPHRGLPRTLVVDGFDDLTPVEEAILDALADAVVDAGGEVVVTLPWDASRPHLFAGSAAARTHLLEAGFVEETLQGFARALDAPLARIARDLFLPRGDAVPTPTAGGESVHLLVAGDPEDEAEAVARAARHLMGDGPRGEVGPGGGPLRGWRDFGVVVRRLDEAGPRFTAAFDRLGIPVRVVGGGESFAGEALVRALRGPLAVLGQATGAGAFDPRGISAWLRWWAHARDAARVGETVDVLEMRWRRRGFPPDWDAYRAQADDPLRAPLALLETGRATLRAARGAEDVHAALAEVIEGLAPLAPAGGLDACGRPLDVDADRRRLRSASVRARLLGLVSELRGAALRSEDAATLRAPEAVAALWDAVEAAKVAVVDRRLDAVNIIDAEEARFWELPVVFVAGLRQGEFPLHPREDVLLRDEEREALRDTDEAPALPLARDREVYERRLFYGAVTRARTRLVLVRPGCDEDGDPISASLFLRDLERVVLPSGRDDARPTGRPAPARSECYTPRDLALFAAAGVDRAGRRAASDRDLALAILERTGAGLLQRAARWRRPTEDPLPLADGAVLPAFERSVERTSATSLNAAVACPHRHFLRAVLSIPEDDAPFEGPSFGPRDRGTLVHEAFHRALLEPDVSAEDVADRVLERLAEDPHSGAPLPSELERDLLRADLTRVVTLFRHREEAIGSPFVPVPTGLEWAFGRAGDVVLGEGDTRFALRGRVDRIDARGTEAVVVDYKLSTGSVTSAEKAYREGLDLQLPLYAAAVEAMHDLRVVGLEWVAGLARFRHGHWADTYEEIADGREEGRGLTRVDPDALRETIDAAVERAGTAVAGVRGGMHVKQRLDPDVCSSCAWKTICRPVFSRVLAPDSGEERRS